MDGHTDTAECVGMNREGENAAISFLELMREQRYVIEKTLEAPVALRQSLQFDEQARLSLRGPAALHEEFPLSDRTAEVVHETSCLAWSAYGAALPDHVSGMTSLPPRFLASRPAPGCSSVDGQAPSLAHKLWAISAPRPED